MNANATPPAGAATGRAPAIGLIVPPADGRVPNDGLRLYPDVTFLTLGLGLQELSISGYDGVIGAVTERGRQLVDGGADAVLLMGTSLSFYRGSDFNDGLHRRLAEACGVPVSTLTTAIECGLRTVGARRLAVATAYDDAVTATLHDFLATKGFEVAGTATLGITDVDTARSTPATQIRDVAERAVAAAEAPDTLLISCGGLDVLDLLAPLEADLGIPVIASSPTGYWHAVTLLGHDPRVPGWGRLLASEPAPLR